MNLQWSILIVGFVAFAYCQQEENGTEIDIGTEDDDSVDVTNSTTAEISVDDDSANSTMVDLIFTWNVTTSDDLTNLTANPETTEQPLQNITTTEEIESNWTICSIKPCKNGGICFEDPFNLLSYTCFCQSGYTGTRCGVKDECSTNEEGTICSKGACVYSKDGLSRACKCSFGMFWDEVRKECREQEPPCFPNPCHNGGTCKIVRKRDFKCDCLSGYENETCTVRNACRDNCVNGKCIFNKEGDLKFCDCNEGFYWNEDTESCQTVDPPCIPNPCKNNGVCEASQSGDYNCSCKGHYLDSSCSLIDHCYSSQDDELMCSGKGNCDVMGNFSKCTCYEGSYLDEDLHSCIDIKKPCLPNPCQNDGLCTPLDSDNYNCTCFKGYAGETCEEYDLCILQGGNAFCGESECRSLHSQDSYYCECPEGHYFDFRTRKCSKIDFCPLMACNENEVCTNSECICQNNYEFSNGTGRCEANFCTANRCPVDTMECSEGKGIVDYYCECKKGHSFNGTHCNDATCVFPGFNDCEQICEVTESDFECKCHDLEFELNQDNKTCTYLGNLTCTNKTCDMGTCIKMNEEEICICSPGFFEKDGICVDACTAGKLPDGYCPNNQCGKTSDGFRCKCEGKYALSRDKVTCTRRRICQNSEIGGSTCFARNATCVEDWSFESGYKCECATGQIETDKGVCKEICSIEEHQRECAGFGARCEVDGNGERICKCPPLYLNPKKGSSCEKPAEYSYLMTIPLDLDSYRNHPRIMKRSIITDSSIDESRVRIDIQMAMAKLFPELIQTNLLNCKENNNYIQCKVELQFVSITEDNFKRLKSPTLCQRKDASSDECLIPPSLVVREHRIKTDLRIQKSNPCEEDLKLSLCGYDTTCISSDMKLFNCTCKSGYAMREKKFLFDGYSSFVEICNDVDECLEAHVCPQNTICKNTIGSYECICKSGFRIKNKSSDPKIDGCIEICNPNPCDHGVCEILGEHDFECRCEAGFAGAFCDLRDENFKHAQTNTIIVGAVLGGALLITIILFITTVSRLKRKKSQEEPDQMLYATEMTERRGGAINNAYQ